jgi:hypothetical protein
MLAPPLRLDDIVLLDNLSSHKATGMPRRSPRTAPGWSTCRPTAPTSTRSSRPLPNSRRCCVTQQSAPARVCGRPSAAPSTSTNRRNAETSSAMRLSNLIGNSSSVVPAARRPGARKPDVQPRWPASRAC